MSSIARIVARVVVVGAIAASIAACSHQRRAPLDLMDRTRDIFLLLRYDANNDHKITRDEMEAGLKADYAAIDVNHDGKLDSTEVQAENQRRWAQEGPQSSPLMDWNMDGNVSSAEFSGAVHSLFATVDRNKDSVVTVDELQSPRVTTPPPPLTPQLPQTPSPGDRPPGGGGGGGYPGGGGGGYPGGGGGTYPGG